MKFPGNLLMVLGLLTAGGALFAFRSRPKTVVTVMPVPMHVTETIAASGRLHGQTESNIGAPNGGRVAQIFVREGDRVKAHQIIARMDSEVLSAQADQAEMGLRTAQGQLAEADSAVQTAEARLRQASRPPLASDVERLRADTEQSVNVGKARLTAARQHQTAMYQHFVERKNGARVEEIEQAQTQVQQAETNLTQLERDWNRQQTLYRDNAISRAESERAETNYLVGKRTLENARSRLQQLKAGNRAEQIAQAEADYLSARAEVVSAEASLNGARRSGAAQMKSLLASPRPEDIAVAKQQWQEAIRAREVVRQKLTEAAAARTLARRRLSETDVKAPFAGTVTQIVTEVGAVTGQNAPIVRLVRTGQPEIHVDLDEANLGKLRCGQEALITNDAFPDARFKAKTSKIGAQVDADRGTVEVQLIPISPPDWIRPGQTFTVNIVLGTAREQLVVPASAVSTVGSISSLLAVENGRVVKKNVKAAPMASRGVPILQGITPQTQIIVEPDSLVEGENVLTRSRN